MLTLHNEPDHGEAVTLARIFERHASPIPAGERVQILGVGLDECDDAAIWSIVWNGSAYWAAPEELRPARAQELAEVEACC